MGFKAVPYRFLSRYALHFLFGLLCFSFGHLYGTFSSSKNNSLKCLDPNHRDLEELRNSEFGLLKHEKSFLVILVVSAPKNFERRAAARQTWLDLHKRLRPDVRHFFVLGSEGLSPEVQAKIEAENKDHKDLLLLPMQDSFKGEQTKLF